MNSANVLYMQLDCSAAAQNGYSKLWDRYRGRGTRLNDNLWCSQRLTFFSTSVFFFSSRWLSCRVMSMKGNEWELMKATARVAIASGVDWAPVFFGENFLTLSLSLQQVERESLESRGIYLLQHAGNIKIEKPSFNYLLKLLKVSFSNIKSVFSSVYKKVSRDPNATNSEA